VEVDPFADICVSLCPIHFFDLFRFKHNILFSMVEYDPVPKAWHPRIAKPELILTPSTHSQRVIQDATAVMVEVVPGGVDVDIYRSREREHREPFTFLYVGANNVRKGTKYIAQAWKLWNETHPEHAKKSKLIMKMTDPEHAKEVEQISPNAYTDFRVLPLTWDDAKRDGTYPLSALYGAAHAFLMPSMGEGFGLTLAEAMATGLPCIYTPVSGMTDLADESCAYPVEYDEHPLELRGLDNDLIESVTAAEPRVESIVAQMEEIYSNYETAKEKGRIAAERMRSEFTWGHAAQKFLDVIAKHYPESA